MAIELDRSCLESLELIEKIFTLWRKCHLAKWILRGYLSVCLWGLSGKTGHGVVDKTRTMTRLFKFLYYVARYRDPLFVRVGDVLPAARGYLGDRDAVLVDKTATVEHGYMMQIRVTASLTSDRIHQVMEFV